MNKRTSKNTNARNLALILIVAHLVFGSIVAYILFSADDPTTASLPYGILSALSWFLVMFILAHSIYRFEKAQDLQGYTLFYWCILVFYFPLGIWVTQPKLNEYVEYPVIGPS